jgi:hypothetical protein
MPAVPASAETAIDAGRQDYSNKRYKSALEQFTRVCRNLSERRLAVAEATISLGF